MKKLLNPFYDENDLHDDGIMRPTYNYKSLDWIFKRIQHNARVQKLPVDMNKVKQYLEQFSVAKNCMSTEQQKEAYKISREVYYGELKVIFKMDNVTPKKNYTKKEAAAYLGVSVKSIDHFLENDNLKKLDKKRGNKVLIQGREILKYKANQKK